MPRRAATVTQADIARAIRAMRDAGFSTVRVRLDGKGAVIEPSAVGPVAPEAAVPPEPEAEVVETEPLVLL